MLTVLAIELTLQLADVQMDSSKRIWLVAPFVRFSALLAKHQIQIALVVKAIEKTLLHVAVLKDFMKIIHLQTVHLVKISASPVRHQVVHVLYVKETALMSQIATLLMVITMIFLQLTAQLALISVQHVWTPVQNVFYVKITESLHQPAGVLMATSTPEFLLVPNAPTNV